MQLVKEYIRENKKVLFIVLIVGLILGFISIYINNKNNGKVYRSDDYVFTKDKYNHDEYLVSELPYINIKGDEINEVNNKLLMLYYEIVELEEKMINYDYYINDGIISLIVKEYYIESPDSYPNISIYNINIDTKEVLSNSEMFNIFNISNDYVKENIVNQIKEYYNYEIKNKYIDKNCDFDCYLSSIKSLPLEECELYVKDGNLYAYKKLNLDRDFYYDAESGFNLFHFKIN